MVKRGRGGGLILALDASATVIDHLCIGLEAVRTSAFGCLCWALSKQWVWYRTV